jgi:hypothetical protein
VADLPKDPALAEAGRTGIKKRLETIGGTAVVAPAAQMLSRLRAMEQTLDPQQRLSREERREAARLAIELEDGGHRLAGLADFTGRVIEQHRTALNECEARLRELTALAGTAPVASLTAA